MVMQQNRVIKFFMVIGIVILTIFIYASYYSNPAVILNRVHSTAALNQHHNIDNSMLENLKNSKNISNNSNSSSQNNNSSSIKQNHNNSNEDNGILINDDHHKHNVIIDENDFIIANISSIPPPQQRTYVPNSIQKLINNADVILKKLTDDDKQFLSNDLPKSPAVRILSNFTKNYYKKEKQNIASTLFNADNQLHIDKIIDQTSQGILTSTIYEYGHQNFNENLCKNNGSLLRLLIIITSAPSHFDARLSIRQTWGHYGNRRDLTIAFILGRTLNLTLNSLLDNENYLYNDLIRGNFIDSYNNLTLKTISTLEWVDKYCFNVPYILKTDDDMFINVPKLLQFIDKKKLSQQKEINNNSNNNTNMIIYGRLAKKWKPIRNKKSKYYVSILQFAHTIFPQFTTGPAYLMTSQVIHDLYRKSLEQTYLKLEDVFTTGIVAQLLNIKRIHVNEFYNRRIAFNPCNIRKSISVHMIKSNEQFDLWKKLLDTSTKCK